MIVVKNAKKLIEFTACLDDLGEKVVACNNCGKEHYVDYHDCYTEDDYGGYFYLETED